MKSRAEHIAGLERKIAETESKEIRYRARREKLEARLKALKAKDEADRNALILEDCKDRLDSDPRERERLRKRLDQRKLRTVIDIELPTSSRDELVVPVTVKLIGNQRDGVHLRLGHRHAGRVLARVEFRLHLKPGLGSCVANAVDDGLVGRQRGATPVRRDVAEESVFDRNALILEDCKDRLDSDPRERERLRKRLDQRKLSDEQRRLFDLPPKNDLGKPDAARPATDSATDEPQAPAINADGGAATTDHPDAVEPDAPQSATDPACDEPQPPANRADGDSATTDHSDATKADAPELATDPASDEGQSPATNVVGDPAAPAHADAVGPDTPESAPPTGSDTPPSLANRADAGATRSRRVSAQPAKPVVGPTEKQIAFITALIVQNPAAARGIGVDAEAIRGMSRSKASWVIKTLKELTVSAG